MCVRTPPAFFCPSLDESIKHKILTMDFFVCISVCMREQLLFDNRTGTQPHFLLMQLQKAKQLEKSRRYRQRLKQNPERYKQYRDKQNQYWRKWKSKQEQQRDRSEMLWDPERDVESGVGMGWGGHCLFQFMEMTFWRCVVNVRSTYSLREDMGKCSSPENFLCFFNFLCWLLFGVRSTPC